MDATDGNGGSGSGGGVGQAGGSPSGGTEGGTSVLCRGLDVLFVVHNSAFAVETQQALADVVPSFIDAAWVALPLGSELHVGVTTTSFFAGSSSSQSIDCKPVFPDRVPAHYIRPQDGNTGENGGQGRLFEHQGRRYFSADTAGPNREPLETWLASALTAVGPQGSTYEMPSAAAAYALHPANAGDNRGFVRDEGAVLALFVLSDNIDTSPEETDAYAALVRAAKARCGGNSCVVTGGLLSRCARAASWDDPLHRFLHAFGQAPVVGEVTGFSGRPEPAEYARVAEELALRIRTACLSNGANPGTIADAAAGGARVEE